MEQKSINKMVDQEAWREAMSMFASGVTVVSCLDVNGQPQGMTVSAFCSLSMDPAMLLVCINPDVPASSHITSSKFFSVNILKKEQEELSNKFAMAPDKERFIGVAYTSAKSGSPIIDDCLVTIDCTLEQKIAGGDHLILLGKPVEIHIGSDKAEPLVYWQRGYRGITQ